MLDCLLYVHVVALETCRHNLVHNGCREFANGFLFAEVLSRYYPNDVHMHSYENVSSTERKKSNWSLLSKLFKVGACSMPSVRQLHNCRHYRNWDALAEKRYSRG